MRHSFIVGVWFLLWADAASARCVTRQEALPDPVIEAGAKDQSRVELLAVEPPREAPVRASSVVAVDLEYHVAGFRPGKHYLTAQFFTLAAGTASIPYDEGPDYLESATGRVRICLPLANLYAVEYMRWPLAFEMTLHDGGRRTSEILAKSVVHTLNPADTPPAALARQLAMPTPEYQDALLRVFRFFETHASFKDSCAQRLTDLSRELEEKYSRWHAPHAALSERVSREQLDLYKVTLPGNEAIAERAHGSTRSTVANQSASEPDFALRKRCESFLQSFGSARMDPEVAYRDELRILREPKQKKPTDET